MIRSPVNRQPRDGTHTQMKADDLFLVYLRSPWPVVTGIGPPVFMGTTLYELYAREPTG